MQIETRYLTGHKIATDSILIRHEKLKMRNHHIEKFKFQIIQNVGIFERI